jgi:hypothetical protein
MTVGDAIHVVLVGAVLRIVVGLLFRSRLCDQNEIFSSGLQRNMEFSAPWMLQVLRRHTMKPASTGTSPAKRSQIRPIFTS